MKFRNAGYADTIDLHFIFVELIFFLEKYYLI
jgi:hypothetical protein